MAEFLTNVVALLPACLIRTTAGIPCPSCGTSRAIVELSRGEFGNALSLNPLAVLILVVLGLIAVAYLALGVSGKVQYFRLGKKGIGMMRRMFFAAVLMNWLYLLSLEIVFY